MSTVCQRGSLSCLLFVNHAALDDLGGSLFHGIGIVRIELVDHCGVVMSQAGGYVDGECSMFCQFRGVRVAETM